MENTPQDNGKPEDKKGKPMELSNEPIIDGDTPAAKPSEKPAEKKEEKAAEPVQVKAAKPTGDKKQKGWLAWTFMAVTSPVWWPAKQALRGAGWVGKKTLGAAWRGLFVNRGAKARIFNALVTAPAILASVAYTGAYTAAYTTAVASDSIIPYSEGDNRGTVQKIREKGVIWPCKTYEISMSQDTFERNDNGSMSNRFNFSIRRFALFNWGEPEIVTQLKQYAEQGVKIQIDYKQSQLNEQRFNETNANGGWFDANSWLQCVQKSPYTLSSDDIKVIGPGTAPPLVPPQ